jgi:hypothetical protein
LIPTSTFSPTFGAPSLRLPVTKRTGLDVLGARNVQIRGKVLEVHGNVEFERPGLYFRDGGGALDGIGESSPRDASKLSLLDEGIELSAPDPHVADGGWLNLLNDVAAPSHFLLGVAFEGGVKAGEGVLVDGHGLERMVPSSWSWDDCG